VRYVEALLACWLPFLAAQARADHELLVLKDGYQIVGDVIAEKAGSLTVDLGFDVVKVPRDQVVERRKAGAPAPAPGPASEATPADGFFQVGPLPRSRPVKDIVQDYGAGVVSVETPSSLGSGFVINAEGHVVTNNHVIEGETRISAVLYQPGPSGLVRRRVDQVEIVALNPFVDLALLKLPVPSDVKLKPVVLGGLDDMSAGDAVFAIGNPLGLERSVSQGILSTLNRSFQGLVYLQTDAAIHPGNSGGPLFNLRGEVIGVINMKASLGENLGFAIPVSYVKDFLRSRAAFAFDKDNPNTGYRYLDPPRRPRSVPTGRLTGGEAAETEKETGVRPAR
jgi:serine protease Do